jgi:3-dehydroquinate synthase
MPTSKSTDGAVAADMQKLKVDLGSRSYDIAIGAGLLARAKALLPLNLAERSVFILTDENIAKTHATALRDALVAAGAGWVAVLALPSGEKTKSFERLEEVIAWLLKGKADRRSVLLTVGGGVIGDLGGFAASIVLRGIPFIQVPTTLLSQVDSSVGGKTGINTAHGKNMVGSFYQPAAVLCDLDTLKTLPRREILAGYAEIVKYGLLGNAPFFDWLEDEGAKVCALSTGSLMRAVQTSCRMKAEIVARDEHEQAGRALLNLGHTFGHALEACAGYDGRLLHGEAVSIGMVLAFRLSARRGHCRGETARRVADHLKTIGLPTDIRDIFPRLESDADAIIARMDHDKKAEGGKPVFILVNDIGSAFVARDVDMADVHAVVQQSLQG